MIWAGRVARCRADSSVAFPDELLPTQGFGLVITPKVNTNLLVQMFCHGLSEPIGYRFEHNRVVIIVILLVGVGAFGDTMSCGDAKPP